MPFSIIKRQLKKELGDDPTSLFASFEEKPFAAASIGQVHRATLKDGSDVVVKVQYPAVKSSIDSDMRQLRRILRLGALFKVNEATLDAIFQGNSRAAGGRAGLCSGSRQSGQVPPVSQYRTMDRYS
jgi:predicted unusual protein kinase regulating ubiquinone biosynthesis (AarF/ABC1/UbiB family)